MADVQLPMDTEQGLHQFAQGVSPANNAMVNGNDMKSQGDTQDGTQLPLTPISEGWCKRFWRWIPTSPQLLENAEQKVLSYVKTNYRGFFVNIDAFQSPPPVNKESSGPTTGSNKCRWSMRSSNSSYTVNSPNNANKDSKDGCKVWTVAFNEASNGGGGDQNRIPMLLIHGLCSSLGLWALNIDELAKDRPLYAIDLVGFGRSSRPKFSDEATEVEFQHVEAIEAWRREMNLEKFVLVGHSMGGFISTAYALKYPQRVAHLVLADPWGFPKKPEDIENSFPPPQSTTAKVFRKIVKSVGPKVNPLAVMRAAGPMGPDLIGKVRPDLVQKFQALNQGDEVTVGEYIFHANAQKPTGEEAFRVMMDFFGWAKHPMQERLGDLHPSLPLTMIYGGRTWLQQLDPDQVHKIRANAPPTLTQVHTIPDTGHHLYAEDQTAFNRLVNGAAELADKLFTSFQNNSSNRNNVL